MRIEHIFFSFFSLTTIHLKKELEKAGKKNKKEDFILNLLILD